jgi:hypothetical protein
LWWHVENQRRYSHSFSSNGNHWSQLNSNIYPRRDGCLNTYSGDNGGTFPIANADDDANPPTDTQTNLVAL